MYSGCFTYFIIGSSHIKMNIKNKNLIKYLSGALLGNSD